MWSQRSRTEGAVILLWSLIAHVGLIGGQSDHCTFDLSRNHSRESFYGTIEPPVPSSLHVRTCEWFLDAEVDHTFVLRVDSVATANRSATLIIIVDGNATELTSDCLQGSCLPSDVYGRSFRIIWNESPLGNQTSNNRTIQSHFPFSFPSSTNNTDDTPTFFVRYAVVAAARCDVPEDVENAYVEHSGSVAVGDSIRYWCVPHHSTKDDGRVVDAKCVLNFDLPLGPTWNRLLPVCHRDRCARNKEVSVVRLDANRSQVIAYDGRPSGDETCRWEVESITAGRPIHIQMDWFDLPELNGDSFPSLEMYDGEVHEQRLLVRLKKGTGSFGFAAVRGKVVVVLKGDGFNETKNDTYEFYVKFTSSFPRCGVPIVPKNGDVRGSEVRYVEDVAVLYTCNEGYHLVGFNRSECPDSGLWSFPPPSCEPGVDSSKGTGSDLVDSGKSVAKMPQLRPTKIHPQSTEEKNGRKSGIIGKEDPKPQPEAPMVTEPSAVGAHEEEESESSFSGEPDMNQRIDGNVKDYDDGLSGYSEFDGYEGEDVLEGNGMISDAGGGLDGLSGVPVLAVVLAVTLPLLACTVIAVSCVVYRKLYPVRMFPGRKFETFENPIYGSSKRVHSAAGTSAAGLAQSPAELQRLTVHASP